MPVGVLLSIKADQGVKVLEAIVELELEKLEKLPAPHIHAS
jgi:hypothetical protein